MVSHFISIAGDFHGTTTGRSLVNGTSSYPALLQQKQNSLFVRALRSEGSDSALIPTVSIYSYNDEIVQPGLGAPSSFLNNKNHIKAVNIDIQASQCTLSVYFC